MNELAEVRYKEFKVLTTSQVAEAYEVEPKKITDNFNNNKERYVEGKHYICLQGQELREFKSETENLGFAPNLNKLYLWTEKGCFLHAKSLNTDNAWLVYERLVDSYFRVRQIANDLSPQMQMLYGMLDQMAQTERQAKEAKQLAEKAVEATENIKEAVKPVFDNWREEIGKKIKRIQYACGTDFKTLNTEMYSELERRAGCDLSTRLRNKKQRMHDAGCTKTEIENTRKIDIIEEDKKLREIFTKIVSEYEIKYCA